MEFGVFIHRSDSIYDGSPAEQYQFPGQYLGRVQVCVGDWIVTTSLGKSQRPAAVLLSPRLKEFFLIRRRPACIWR